MFQRCMTCGAKRVVSPYSNSYGHCAFCEANRWWEKTDTNDSVLMQERLILIANTMIRDQKNLPQPIPW